MEHYGVCLDAAMEGAYPATFVAALAGQLPQDCRWRVSYDPDAWWTGDRCLQAALVNTLRGLVWGMSDKKRRGPEPTPVGPTWAKGGRRRGKAMGQGRLLELLSRPRREA